MSNVRAGDSVVHGPSGETWLVAAMSPDGTELVCCGWPETVAKVADCTLAKACGDAEHAEMLRQVIESCGDQLRGSWARAEKRRSEA